MSKAIVIRSSFLIVGVELCSINEGNITKPPSLLIISIFDSQKSSTPGIRVSNGK